MKKLLFFVVLIFFTKQHYAQDTSGTWMLAFPITGYRVDLGDSVTLVQIEMPSAGPRFTEKQIAILKGVYRNGVADTATVGWGRCQLIKGNYFYFGIHHDDKKRTPKQGDLLYAKFDKDYVYHGRMQRIAAHAINFQAVDERNFYDRWRVMNYWSAAAESAMIDTLINDIVYTAIMMKAEVPSMDKKILTGDYKDRMLFEVMKNIKAADVINFIDYVLARPNNYRGNSWKISEVFATWLDAGAPTVLKE